MTFCCFLTRRIVVCTGGTDDKLRLFDCDPSSETSREKAVKHVFEGHGGSINSCAFSIDGSTIASCRLFPSSHSPSLSFHVYSANFGICLNDFTFCYLKCTTKELSDDATARLWSAESGEVLRVIDLASAGIAVCWGPESNKSVCLVQRIQSFHHSHAHAIPSRRVCLKGTNPTTPTKSAPHQNIFLQCKATSHSSSPNGRSTCWWPSGWAGC